MAVMWKACAGSPPGARSELSSRHDQGAIDDLLAGGFNRGDRVRGDLSLEAIVPDDRDDPFLHSEPLHLWLELVIVNASSYFHESARNIENGGSDDDLGSQVVLVLVGAKAADFPLAAGLKDSSPGLVALMEDEVTTGVDQRKGGQMSGTQIVEVADVDLANLELRIDRLRARPEGQERGVDRRQLDATDEA